MKAKHTYSFFHGGSYAYFLAVDNNDRTHVLSHNADGWTALSLKEFHEIAGPEAVDALAAALTKMLANPPKTIDLHHTEGGELQRITRIGVFDPPVEEDGIEGYSFPFKINDRHFEVCVHNDAIECAARAKLTGDKLDKAFDKYQDRFVSVALAKFSRDEIEGDKIFISREDVERFRDGVRKVA